MFNPHPKPADASLSSSLSPVQDHAAAVGGDSGDSQPDAGVGRSHAIGGLRQPLGRHHKRLDQSETQHQDRGARLAGQREHLDEQLQFVGRQNHTRHGVQGDVYSSSTVTKQGHTCINNKIFTAY